MKEYGHDEPLRTLRVADLDIADKPREKALQNGIATLSNAELLAIVFGSGLPGRSVVDLSRDILLDNDNRLSRLARMSVHEVVRKYKGIGEAKAISLAAAFELGARCALDMKQLDPQVKGSDTVYELLRGKMELLNHEEFRVVHLNRANRIIFEETVSRGGTASTLVDVKLVMKSALDKLSSALIFVHNHPSGNLNPSAADDQLTRRLKQAADLLEIRVLDHIIISPQGYYSYNDNGRL
ncbi:MAG: DNA repair protein RadC [Barnesiella sp.]|nr:DNA repair protein RadC [Bacteroidales bacterium]MBD5247756.1 DNA repair protein RadC [Barnesiella sp.]MBD5257856.1 DNA repair protein RadC [Barnesiella sp.]